MSKKTIVAMVPITDDDNRDALLRIALRTYLGEQCICGHIFKELYELDYTVFHTHSKGRISHKKCFDKQNKDLTK